MDFLIIIMNLAACLMFASAFSVAVPFDSDAPHQREKRTLDGEEVSDALKKAINTMTTDQLALAFGLENVDKLAMLQHGLFGAVLRVTLKDKKEFALKVAQSRYFGKFEKASLIALSAKKEDKYGFVTKYLKRFSSEKVTVDGNEFETLATVLTGPNFRGLLGKDNEFGKANLPVAAIRRFLHKLAVDLVAMHDAGWCHNDMTLGNVAINGQTGKQDSYYVIDYGTASEKSKTENGCWKDFHDFLGRIVQPLNDLYKDSAEADRPMTTAEHNKIKRDVGTQYKAGMPQLLATLKALADRDDGAKLKQLTPWVPGTNSKPPYAPVTPVDV